MVFDFYWSSSTVYSISGICGCFFGFVFLLLLCADGASQPQSDSTNASAMWMPGWEACRRAQCSNLQPRADELLTRLLIFAEREKADIQRWKRGCAAKSASKSPGPAWFLSSGDVFKVITLQKSSWFTFSSSRTLRALLCELRPRKGRSFLSAPSRSLNSSPSASVGPPVWA